MKKAPERMCVACRSVASKFDLMRIVKTPQGDITLDFSGKANGRGAYICKSKECLLKCIKSKALERAFNCKIDESIYQQLLEQYDKQN